MGIIRHILGLKTERDRWQEENYPIRKLIALVISEALARNADRISLGTPSDELEKIPLTDPIPTAVSEPEADAALSRLEKELVEIQEEAQESLNILPAPVFVRNPATDVPLWFRVDRKWVQIKGPPFKLLHDIITVLELMFLHDSAEDLENRRRLLVLPDSGVQVYMELWFEEDRTYAIALERRG